MAKHHHVLVDLNSYKYELKRIARELRYSGEIIGLIEKAQTEGEALRAMMKGRGEIHD